MVEKNKKRLYWQVPLLIFLIVGTIFIVKQQQDMPYQRNEGTIFGTTYHITYQYDKDVNEDILKELNKVDASLSTFNPQSVISQINQNKSNTVDEMFAQVFSLSKEISKETDGAFDVTVAPLVNEWGFGFKNGVEPTKQIIDSLRAITGYEKVSLVGKTLRKKDKRIMIDCSAIAKGFGTDVVANYLRSLGVKNFMVEIGGEVVTSGLSEQRLPWKIGVIKPTEDKTNTNQELQTIINVTNKAMATSGNYRNFYYKNGKKYAHTIDPKTGYPVQHNILSSTVITDDCASADAYATAFMVMGLDKAKKVLEKHSELMAYFIYSDKNGKNAVWFSPSMKNKIVE